MPALDPKNINGRIYNQVAELLTQLETGEHITLKERVQALVAISRIQMIFVGLRKEKLVDADTGSAVKRYATAFSKNDARGRKKVARGGKSEPEPDSEWFERDEFAPDDDDAA